MEGRHGGQRTVPAAPHHQPAAIAERTRRSAEARAVAAHAHLTSMPIG